MLRTLQLAGRSQLDLHIEGATERSHETSASALGEFMTRVAEAVRAVAKCLYGLERIRGDINVLAPASGSVRVVFVEQADRGEGDTRRSDEAWAVGMERVAGTFELANQGLDQLGGSLADLDPAALRALRSVANTVLDHEWGLKGTLTTRSGDERPARLSRSAAQRLVDTIGHAPTREYPLVVPGVVDGWRWSTSIMRLVPDRGAAIEAHVPRGLQTVVADANVERGRRVSASFRVIETATTGRTGAIKRDYELKQIELLASLDDE
jgi:hypothetical protein